MRRQAGALGLAKPAGSGYLGDMRFEVKSVPNANEDLESYTAREQQIILGGITDFLEFDADIESKRRKQLRPNPLVPWELRIGDFRVFYEIREKAVRILTIGHKVS